MPPAPMPSPAPESPGRNGLLPGRLGGLQVRLVSAYADEDPEIIRDALRGAPEDPLDRLTAWFGQWMLLATLFAIPAFGIAGRVPARLGGQVTEMVPVALMSGSIAAWGTCFVLAVYGERSAWIRVPLIALFWIFTGVCLVALALE